MTTPNETTKKDAVFAVTRIITMLRTLSPGMPMQQADILFQIAIHPGLTMAELVKRTGLSQSSVSRNVAALSKYHRLGEPGLDLVETLNDPRDPRRRLMFLNTNGKTFITKLLRNIDETYSIDRDTDARVAVDQMHEEVLAKAEPRETTRGRIKPIK